MTRGDTDEPLLASDEPAPVEVLRPAGRSAFFIVCDHAGARIPRALGSLGLTEADLARHIAWDIGAASVARRLADAFDACAVLQRYSRLVIDCNRPPASTTSIVSESERTPIPGNRHVDAAERRRRERALFTPYHARIRRLLDERAAAGRRTVLVAMHSFTPQFLGVARPWQVGVLYQRDPRFARALLAVLRADAALSVGDNQPYAVGDLSDYAIPEHGEKRGLPHVEIEVRQDLIADEFGQREWAERLRIALTLAAHDLEAR
ncbi:MAG TPA: N-formylglutamate amidohydrolase [Steroidobacteraceae bacterium]|nr:N-formylglutamate amidohydrolase [Steroidobacteraceae bacterium]